MAFVAAYPLLVKNAVDDAEFAAADFLVAVFGVEMLGAYEDDGGVEVQDGVAQFSGAFLQGRVDCLSESLSLKVGVDAHAFDFGSIRIGSAEGAHRDDSVFDGADEKFAAVVQVDSFDLTQIDVKRAVVNVSAGGEQGCFVQVPHGGVVG